VCSSDIVYPCLAVLPMGHTWSVYFAQSVSEFQTSLVGALADARLLCGEGDLDLQPE
jgi:hypothetical protein